MTDNKKPLAQMTPDELCFAYANPCATPRHLLSHGDALRALIQRATIEATERDWQPSAADYDRAIHHNPDARAWADMFVQTFPRLADKHGLMVGWFANAMMAMHDSMPAAATARERDVAHTQLAEAQSLADRLQGERDTLAWDLGVAERKLASAGREGMNEAIEFVRVWRGFEVDLAGECGPSTGNVLLREMRNFRDNHYLVPTPADSGTEGVSDGTLRASDVAFAVLAASTLPAARANIERLLASTLPAVRANIERLAVALAREAR